MITSPIALFAYNRPIHLQKSLTALAANPEAKKSKLFIFLDGAKTEKEQGAVEDTRSIARCARGFASVECIEQQRNIGLANSTINGLTYVVNSFGTVIMVEDDNIVSPYFLQYVNNGLALYADDERVACIHGWVFPHSIANPPATFFLRGGDCWGWGTWKNSWDHFVDDPIWLYDELERRNLLELFDGHGTYAYSAMLRNLIDGKIDSWAIRWLASTFLKDMYTLYPGKTLVHNIGNDGTGTHVGDTELNSPLTNGPVRLKKQPVVDHPVMRAAYNDFMRPVCRPKVEKKGIKRWMPALKRFLTTLTHAPL
jgi:hypothetical protein